MISTIDINKIETLPLNSLAILKDNFGPADIYALCLRLNTLNNSTFEFKIAFTSIDEVPICILMIKNDDKLYKCLIDLNKTQEFNFLKQLMKLKTFNLFVLSDKKEHSIIKIDNSNSQNFVDAMTAVHTSNPTKEFDNLENTKQKIIDKYSDNELWNL